MIIIKPTVCRIKLSGTRQRGVIVGTLIAYETYLSLEELWFDLVITKVREKGFERCRAAQRNGEDVYFTFDEYSLPFCAPGRINKYGLTTHIDGVRELQIRLGR